MLPTEWGPIVWYNFHTISYTYNEERKDEYVKFFKSMAYILPCYTCTEHFKNTLSKSPPEVYTVNRDKMIGWLNNMHNQVNKRLKKKNVSLEMAKKIYYNSDDNLKLDHLKITKFVQIMQRYLSTGVSSIVLYHGTNVIINYCYYCPCLECREKLVKLAKDNVNKKYNLKTFVTKMINTIDDCEISLNPIRVKEGEKVDLSVFEPNQKISKIMVDNKLKVIVKKVGSTPGIRKAFVLKPNKKYLIKLSVTVGKKMMPFLWIRDVKTNTSIRHEIDKSDEVCSYEYESGEGGNVEIGILLSKPKYNDIYYVNELSFL
jgi:hypothetical protein